MSHYKENILALAVIAVLMVACSSSPRPGELPSNEPAVQLVDVYRIGVDDVVRIDVWRNTDLGVTVPVRPDGKISVPLVGDIMVGGLTPEEVADRLTVRLADFIKEPQVAVILVELNSHDFLSRIRITGAVRTPLTVPYRQGITVMDAVLAAGGLSEFASPQKTRLFRQQGDDVASYKIQLQSILNKGDLRTNYLLQPGDVITVPERAL